MTIIKAIWNPDVPGRPHRVHRSKKGRKKVFGRHGAKAAKRFKIKKWELTHEIKWKSSDVHVDDT